MRNIVYSLSVLALLSAASLAQANTLGHYWNGFRHFWGRNLGELSGITGIVVIAGIAGIFIVTRGKWLK